MTTQSDSAAPYERDVTDGYESGMKLGRYTLVAQLASGGMAHVWTAEPDQGSGLGRTVAIKVIRQELARDREYARMFVDEATIASAIDHPNVCQTYELDRHSDGLFMAMEWVPGESLGGMLRRGNRFDPLDPALAVRICADACAGLHAAHEALDEKGRPLGVIHRDVSPPNILISLQGQVKVSDFGVAKARRQLHERTKTGEVKGKFGYLAPEQIAGGDADRRIDIYAMGCVLYVATMGLRPFGNGPQAMPKILLGQYRRPSEIDPMYPPGLEQIIVRSLEHDPADRFQTADEMRAALEQWLVDCRQVVSPSDVARALAARMKSESLEAIRSIQNRRRGRSSVTFSALLESLDEIEPPTAASGLVTPPEDLEQRSKQVPPIDPAELQDAVDGETKIESSADLSRKARRSDEEDRSGWHRSGRLRVSEQSAPTATSTNADTPPRPSRGLQAMPPPPEARGLPAILWRAALAGMVVAVLAWFLIR